MYYFFQQCYKLLLIYVNLLIYKYQNNTYIVYDISKRPHKAITYRKQLNPI